MSLWYRLLPLRPHNEVPDASTKVGSSGHVSAGCKDNTCWNYNHQPLLQYIEILRYIVNIHIYIYIAIWMFIHQWWPSNDGFFHGWTILAHHRNIHSRLHRCHHQLLRWVYLHQSLIPISLIQPGRCGFSEFDALWMAGVHDIPWYTIYRILQI